VQAGLNALYQTVVNLCYPPFCVSCRKNLDQGWLCRDCLQSAVRITAPFCRICSRPYSGEIGAPFSCPDCEDKPPAFECVVTRYQATGIVRDLIHRFKYSGEFHLRNLLVGWLEEALGDPRITQEPFDAFVPVPLHATRIRERGYDQIAALVGPLGKRRSQPVWPCLRRSRYTESQTRFSRKERLQNLRNAFELRKGRTVLHKRLLLVDDVLTTGSTLDECARVLIGHGARSVRAVTVARR
jgi:competence protein ComFC